MLAKSIGYLVDWKFEYMEKRLRGLVMRLVAVANEVLLVVACAAGRYWLLLAAAG